MKSFTLLSLASMATSVLAADWATWRGPTADGISTETIKASGDVAWKAEVGSGYSGVTVMDGKLLASGNKENVDSIYCLDATTGKQIWVYSQPSDEGKPYKGTLASPVTDGKHVWFTSRIGEMTCVDFATGKKVWGKMLCNDKSPVPRWNVSTSALLYKDLVVVGIGSSGIALNKNTGDIVWSSEGVSTHGTPTLMTYKGKDYLLILSAKNINVVEPLTGKVVAATDIVTQSGIIGASPLIVDADKGMFMITSAYKTGHAVMLAFDGKSLNEVWTVKHLNSQFSTPVLHEGTIYGSHGNTNARKSLRAIDAQTGELLWTGSQRFGSPMIAGDKLVYLDERGTLTYLKLDKTKEDVISSHDVISGGKCWQMPVVANGYLYCRNSLGTLVCVKVQ